MSYNSFESGPNEAEFKKLSQTVATSIQKIWQNVSSMNRMVNQFGTAQDSPEIKQQLHQIRTYTQQLIKDTDNSLKDIVNCKDRQLKIQRDRLVDEFTAALTAFQAVQKKTVDLEKSAVRQAKAAHITIPKPPGSNNSQHNNQSNSNSGPFENNFIDNKGPSQIQMQDEIDLQALEEQERTIRELEENIVGVNEIYKKLGALVYEQGNTVDSIEASVEHTSVFVQEGTEQLKRATHYQNLARKKKMILFLILAIVSIILLYFIFR